MCEKWMANLAITIVLTKDSWRCGDMIMRRFRALEARTGPVVIVGGDCSDTRAVISTVWERMVQDYLL